MDMPVYFPKVSDICQYALNSSMLSGDALVDSSWDLTKLISPKKSMADLHVLKTFPVLYSIFVLRHGFGIQLGKPRVVFRIKRNWHSCIGSQFKFLPFAELWQSIFAHPLCSLNPYNALGRHGLLYDRIA